MHWIENRYPQWLLQNRLKVILICLLVVMAAASGGRLISFTTNYRVFFSEDNPQLIAFETLEGTYVQNDNVMIVLAPRDGKIFTPRMLSIIEEYTEKAW